MITQNNVQYFTAMELKERFNTTFLRKFDGIIQIQHFQTKLYHYMIEDVKGWRDSGMTAIKPNFFIPGED